MPDKSRETNTTLRYLADHEAAEDVVAMGRRVEELVEHPGWQIVTELAGKKRESELRALEGDILQHEVYVARHQFLRGLAAFAAIADGVIEAGKRADRDLQALVHQQTAEDD